MLEVGDDAVDTFVPQHHLLVVALDLVGVAGPDQHGEMLKNFDSLPLELRVKDIPEVGQVCDVDIVLHHSPTIELQGALLLLKAF